MCVRLFDPIFNQLAGGWHRIRPGRNYALCIPRKGLERQNPTRLPAIRILALDRPAMIAGFGSKIFKKWSRTAGNLLWYILPTSKKRLRRDKYVFGEELVFLTGWLSCKTRETLGHGSLKEESAGQQDFAPKVEFQCWKSENQILVQYLPGGVRSSYFARS